MNKFGQSTLQLIIPLILLLFVLLSLGILIPMLSTTSTIALVIGLIIFLASFASTEIALYILIFSMLLSPEFIVGATEGASLGRGVTVRFDDFILIIIGFSWLAKMSIHKELGLFLRTPLNKPIAYYILICLVSTLLGALFGRVQLMTGIFFVLKYFEYVIIYFMVTNLLETRRQARYYLWAMLITCAIVSVIGISQIPLGGRVTAPFEGASGEPNTFGGYLVFMISITFGLFLTSPSFRNQLIYSSLIVLFAIPLFYTQSRSSYLAVIPSLLTFLYLSEKRKWVIAAIALIALSLPYITPDIAKKRISYTFTQGQDRMDVVEIGGVKLDTSTSARLTSWKAAARDWNKHPLFGYGVTGYRFVDAQYVRVITETGFLGLVSFLFLLTTVTKRTYGIFRSAADHFEEGLVIGFLAGFMGLMFHAIGANTFIIVRIMEPFWFMTALVISLPQLRDDHLKPL
ncbi:O-antigen ligase family protein [Deltaproteobacteria bacterium]|nr:O-antigen ligase family protein [Deltaproteobacteria bacterium]